MSQQQSGNS